LPEILCSNLRELLPNTTSEMKEPVSPRNPSAYAVLGSDGCVLITHKASALEAPVCNMS
jgi:hypothetical protein